MRYGVLKSIDTYETKIFMTSLYVSGIVGFNGLCGIHSLHRGNSSSRSRRGIEFVCVCVCDVARFSAIFLGILVITLF